MLRLIDMTAIIIIRGHSSVGRAPAWHAGGQRFESAWLHVYEYLYQESKSIYCNFNFGAIAQMVEHLHGMQGVSGSSPLGSINVSASYIN